MAQALSSGTPSLLSTLVFLGGVSRLVPEGFATYLKFAIA